MPPERSNSFLATYIPDSEFGPCMSECFDVEADSRDSSDGFREFKFVEKSGFARIIQTKHKDPIVIDK